jgi:tight adherence protein B
MRFLFSSDIARLESLNGDFSAQKKSDQSAVKKEESSPNFIQNLLSRFKSTAKSRAFESDYPTFLLSLASSVRTGLDPISAIKTVAEMLPLQSPLKIELNKLNQKLESGESEEDAILSFGESIGHPDVVLLTTSLLLARREGSSLGACLQRLNKVTRQRQSFRRKSKAAVAMQRLSSFGIAGCSLVIGGMQVAMNPDAFMQSLHHPLGRMFVGFGVVLMFVGTAWMLFIGRSRV